MAANVPCRRAQAPEFNGVLFSDRGCSLRRQEALQFVLCRVQVLKTVRLFDRDALPMSFRWLLGKIHRSWAI